MLNLKPGGSTRTCHAPEPKSPAKMEQNPKAPSPPEGKAKSCQNALKHGLLSTRTIIGNEDANEFKLLRDNLIADYKPASTQELMLVDRIANAAWRTLRVRQMEQHLADMSIDTWQAKRKHIKTRTAKTDTEALTISMVEEDLWRVMHRYDTQISRDFFRSVATLERMQKERQIRERHDAREARNPAPQPQKQAGRSRRKLGSFRSRSQHRALSGWAEFPSP